MKIGILIDELIPGGFQKVAIMEAKYFNMLGHEAVLVVLHRIKNEGYEDLIKRNNIKVIRISDRLPFCLRLNFRFPFFAFFSFFHIFYPFFIWGYVKRGEFDVCITHGTYTAFSSIAIKKKLHIPFISFIHDSVTYIIENKYKDKFPRSVLGFLMLIAKKLDRAIVGSSNCVIAFPEMLWELKKIYPAYQDYHEIFNGCEVIPESEIIFNKSNFAISVTKWDQGKNFNFILDIWNSLDAKIPLKVIGSVHPDSLKNEMERLISDRGLSNYITIIGQITEEELCEYYSNARFLVHPCREAFGMTILEASAHGCPAIFTNNSGVAELFPDKIRLEMPSEKDIVSYVNTIRYIGGLPQQEYVELVDDYYKVAIENTWEAHCRKIEKLIHLTIKNNV